MSKSSKQTLRENFNHHAALATLLAIVLMVAYDSDPYDIWDLFTGFIVVLISWEYLAYEIYFDRISSFLASTIFASGLVTIVCSGLQIGYHFFTDKNDDMESLVIFSVTLITSIIIHKLCGYKK